MLSMYIECLSLACLLNNLFTHSLFSNCYITIEHIFLLHVILLFRRCNIFNTFKIPANNQNNMNACIKPHKCTCCYTTFNTNEELMTHMSYYHTHVKPHWCPDCNYKIHPGQKPYERDICHAKTQSNSLKSHKMTHEDETRFNCDLCTYSSNSKKMSTNP